MCSGQSRVSSLFDSLLCGFVRAVLMPLIREDTQRLCLGSETAGRALACGFRFNAFCPSCHCGFVRGCLFVERRVAPEVWALTTETLGGGEEAHRRWPKGRSERGARKAKHRPPIIHGDLLHSRFLVFYGRARFLLCFCQSHLDGIIRAHQRYPWLIRLQPRPARGLLKKTSLLF